MGFRAAFAKAGTSLRSLLKDRRGNVAITFAIATLPVIGAVGAAVDYSRANAAKAAMQAALDSTALMLSRDAATLSNADLNTKASNYFNSLFVRPEATSVTVNATYTANGGSQVVVNGAARVPTTLMSIAGYDYVDIAGTATSKWGSERLRVALVLDNTGSMAQDGKMTALKSAAKNLLLQLKGASSTNGDVYVSIIPFSRDVNIGSGNYNQTWLNWTDWDAAQGSCSSSSNWYKTKSSCQNAGYTWTIPNHNTWNGCVEDRDQNYDQNNTAATSTSAQFYPDQFNACPTQAMALTYDWTALINKIDAMSSNGNTNQPIGLVWGWHSLAGNGPMSVPAKDSNYTYKEYIILMSDGLNTENRWSSSQTQIDKRMYDSSKSGAGTCANIKAAGITIYSIQVDTGGDGLSTIMQNCASSSDKFWRITSAGDLGTVFTAIGTNLTKLRVAN